MITYPCSTQFSSSLVCPHHSGPRVRQDLTSYQRNPTTVTLSSRGVKGRNVLRRVARQPVRPHILPLVAVIEVVVVGTVVVAVGESVEGVVTRVTGTYSGGGGSGGGGGCVGVASFGTVVMGAGR